MFFSKFFRFAPNENNTNFLKVSSTIVACGATRGMQRGANANNQIALVMDDSATSCKENGDILKYLLRVLG